MSSALIYADSRGIIFMWNQEATRIFGFAEEEAVGQALDLIIPADFRERHWRGYHDTIRTGSSRYTERPLSVSALHKDGSRVLIELIFVPTADDDGRIASIAALAREAT